MQVTGKFDAAVSGNFISCVVKFFLPDFVQGFDVEGWASMWGPSKAHAHAFNDKDWSHYAVIDKNDTSSRVCGDYICFGKI